MALGIRGSCPVWLLADLQGALFDDTFYLFVLENTIPYVPATVYHDPDLNTPWTQPIQFLGNGTLPIDIYFEADFVYRLEFRQGPTQAYPLIYEVNDYVAGSGGSSPVDTIAFASSNQITNPQFALMSLQNPVTISSVSGISDLEVAPGWFLFASGTGTVTISQVALTNSNSNPSNAPYALRLTMNGWTDGSVILFQRFEQNGMLWANKIVSSTVTARLEGSPQSISAELIDSNGSVIGNVLPITAVNESWNEFTGYAQLPSSTNPDVPPAAYIDYRLSLPSNIDIYLTSFQLVAQDLPIKPSFEQDSINRQIDHTYNNAYPIVPVGSIIDFGGFVVPAHYYLCDGSAKDRLRDYLLFNALTVIEAVTLISGTNTFTSASIVDYHQGMKIEGIGIPASTTITLITGAVITMSNNATATGPSNVRFFAWGNGDGAATFNVPDLRAIVRAGANGTLFAGENNGVGLAGGEQTHTLTIAEIPSHNHPGSSGFWNLEAEPYDRVGVGTFRYPVYTGGLISFANTPVTVTVAYEGGSAAHNNIQPTALVKTCIRYR